MAVLEKSAPCPWENKKKYEASAEGEDVKEGETGEAGEQESFEFAFQCFNLPKVYNILKIAASILRYSK